MFIPLSLSVSLYDPTTVIWPPGLGLYGKHIYIHIIFLGVGSLLTVLATRNVICDYVNVLPVHYRHVSYSVLWWVDRSLPKAVMVM